MPRAETYERLLLAALADTDRAFDVTWLRLSTPAYASSDRARIERVYVPLAAALDRGDLDGLIVSGAPVEELPFEAVTYWHELSELLRRARETVPSTLGLCWGALALAQLLGIDKSTFGTKLFGVFALDVLANDHPLVRGLEPSFLCPQSRHSGLTPTSVAAAAAAGGVRVLAGSPKAGPVILDSTDHRYVMHVGHPEYDADRLAFEYERDRASELSSVHAPENFDLQQPAATWRLASVSFFRAWFDALPAARL
jgi:homoserine O-succinyltransferase